LWKRKEEDKLFFTHSHPEPFWVKNPLLPKPERKHFVEEFKKEIPHYKVRHFAKSGITGLAQVNGWRGDTSIAKRVECDIHYLENWSFWLDLKIIWLTVFGRETQKNAY
jgi:lipopolysaccharide/colanic/teichoic acid biosynthesis glycosyltransferase